MTAPAHPLSWPPRSAGLTAGTSRSCSQAGGRCQLLEPPQIARRCPAQVQEACLIPPGACRQSPCPCSCSMAGAPAACCLTEAMPATQAVEKHPTLGAARRRGVARTVASHATKHSRCSSHSTPLERCRVTTSPGSEGASSSSPRGPIPGCSLALGGTGGLLAACTSPQTGPHAHAVHSTRMRTHVRACRRSYGAPTRAGTAQDGRPGRTRRRRWRRAAHAVSRSPASRLQPAQVGLYGITCGWGQHAPGAGTARWQERRPSPSAVTPPASLLSICTSTRGQPASLARSTYFSSAAPGRCCAGQVDIALGDLWLRVGPAPQGGVGEGDSLDRQPAGFAAAGKGGRVWEGGLDSTFTARMMLRLLRPGDPHTRSVQRRPLRAALCSAD